MDGVAGRCRGEVGVEGNEEIEFDEGGEEGREEEEGCGVEVGEAEEASG